MSNSSMGSAHEGSIQWPIAPWANALTTELHLAPLCARILKPRNRRSSGIAREKKHAAATWATHPKDRITHTTTAFYYTSRGSLVGTRNSSMGPPCRIQQPLAPWANALTTELHLAPAMIMSNETKKAVCIYMNWCNCWFWLAGTHDFHPFGCWSLLGRWFWIGGTGTWTRRLISV